MQERLNGLSEQSGPYGIDEKMGTEGPGGPLTKRFGGGHTGIADHNVKCDALRSNASDKLSNRRLITNIQRNNLYAIGEQLGYFGQFASSLRPSRCSDDRIPFLEVVPDETQPEAAIGSRDQYGVATALGLHYSRPNRIFWSSFGALFSIRRTRDFGSTS